MDKEFWFSRWLKNEIGFHLNDPHHFLQRFFPRLQMRQDDIIFVPLCGKSPDLVWLRGKGFNVAGVELSRVAVEAFFRENNLPGQWAPVSDMPRCHAEGYTIYCGDFFKLTADELPGVSTVYDRAALVALPPELRARYAEHIAELLPSGSRVLLISYEYDQAETYGPPFSVPLKELELLFREDFQIEVLAEEDVLWSHQGLSARGVTQLTEYAVLLTRK